MIKLILTLTFILSLFCNSYSLTVYLSTGDDVCNENKGFIQSSVSGGMAPYNYLWSNGATTADLQNIPAGTYTLTVFDALGDSASNSATITNFTNIPLSLLYSDAGQLYPCYNQCNGVIIFNVNSNNGWGTNPHTFTSSYGNINYNSPYLQGNGVGIHNICGNTNVTVTVTDALGCTGQTGINLSEAPYTTNPVISSNPSCNSQSNGSVIIDSIPTGFMWPTAQIGITSTTNSNCVGSGFNLPHTFYNQQSGNYFLQVCYGFTIDGCKQYFPFTITDLGTNYSTVEGNVFVDLNSNCVNDTAEMGIPNSIIEFTPGPFYAISNSLGHYSINLPWNTYNITQYPPNNLIQSCPVNPNPVTLSLSNPSVTANFADSSNIPFDVEGLLGSGIARPGFDFNYSINIKNHSYEPCGLLLVTFDYDPMLTFISANPAPLSTSPGQVVWQLSSIQNFQTAYASATFNVPANPLLIGDTLTASVNVLAANPENNLSNNSTVRNHLITGSFDPNEKHVTPEGNFLPALNDFMNYTILFQNTGNDTAFNVVIIDTLDANLDVTSFTPGAASHPFETELSGQGIVKFIFNNILLPDSIVDEPNSHGFVSFSIKLNNDLPHHTLISNTSDIYFDFNPSIKTNTVQSNVDLTLAIETSSDVICAGDQVTLNLIPELQGTATWYWYENSCSGSLSGTGNSIVVSPASTTTYYVRDSAGAVSVNNCYLKTISVITTIQTSQAVSICFGESYSNGTNTYSTSGIYSDTLISSNGCDSIVTTNLTVQPAIESTLFGIDLLIISNATGGTFQWVDCDNSFAPIPGETGQSFYPVIDGNYAVIITDNGCTDTSECVQVIGIGISEINNGNFNVFPNPNEGLFTIETEQPGNYKLEISNALGEIISVKEIKDLKTEIV